MEGTATSSPHAFAHLGRLGTMVVSTNITALSTWVLSGVLAHAIVNCEPLKTTVSTIQPYRTTANVSTVP